MANKTVTVSGGVTLQRGREFYPPGSALEMPAEEAEALEKRGKVVIDAPAETPKAKAKPAKPAPKAEDAEKAAE